MVGTNLDLERAKIPAQETGIVAFNPELFKGPNIRFEDGQTVWQALNDYRKAKPIRGKEADFSDTLIIRKAQFVAGGQETDFNGVYTFDRAARKLPGAKVPK